MDQNIKDLNLLLLMLSGWEEESRSVPGEKLYRSWKGYLFEALNELEEEKMIQQFKNTKSVIITKEGLRRARELKDRLASPVRGNGGTKAQAKRAEGQSHERW